MDYHYLTSMQWRILSLKEKDSTCALISSAIFEELLAKLGLDRKLFTTSWDGSYLKITRI